MSDKLSVRFFKINTLPLQKSKYSNLRKEAFSYLDEIKKRTKRKPYIKSKYFKKRKIFINLFLVHLFNKRPGDIARRLPLIPCGLELIRNSTYKPTIRVNSQKTKELLYRFYGMTRQNQKFAVQVKQSENGRLYLMSIFPYK